METIVSSQEEERYAELQLLALDYAREGNTHELDKMISYGMPINLCTNKNDTLLMLATYNGNYETALMLIKNGADLNKVNQREQTPLEGVCFKGYMEIVKYLKENADLKEHKILGVDVESISNFVAKIKSFFRKN